MLKRTTINHINIILEKNKNWKILDIGCGYRAHKNATVIADQKDLSAFYPNRAFVKINDKKLPFKDDEFDFVVASHVIEHVDDLNFFLNEIERISSKGYIELPSKLSDNLVFENKSDHIWWFEFNDTYNKLIASKRKQIVEPFLTVSMGKLFEEIFRDSLILELYWEEKIDYKIENNLKYNNYKKITFLKLIKKYFSKKIRTFIK